MDWSGRSLRSRGPPPGAGARCRPTTASVRDGASDSTLAGRRALVAPVHAPRHRRNDRAVRVGRPRDGKTRSMAPISSSTTVVITAAGARCHEALRQRSAAQGDTSAPGSGRRLSIVGAALDLASELGAASAGPLGLLRCEQLALDHRVSNVLRGASSEGLNRALLGHRRYRLCA